MNHGHGGYTNHGCRCPICHKAASDYQKAYQVDYRIRQREKRNAYHAKYNRAHKDELRAREASTHGKALRRKNSQARRGRKRSQFIEDVDPRVVYEMHGGMCGICKEFVSIAGFHVDHVVPLDKGGLHGYVNVQPAHPRCNLSKGARLAA